MKKQLFSVMLCLGAIGSASLSPMPVMASVTQAQTVKVKGQVVDETGEPLVGATVKVKDSNAGTITDFDGNFQLDVKSNATLVISYLVTKTVRLPCADALLSILLN